MTKKSYLYDRYFVANKILLLDMLNLLKIKGFSRFFVHNFRLFLVFYFQKFLNSKFIQVFYT